MSNFGDYIRARRKALGENSAEYGLRTVASLVGISPTYLSRLETGKADPPSEEIIESLATVLGENPDVLLALVGKISPRLVAIISKHPELFAYCIETIAKRPEVLKEALEQLNKLPDHSIIRVVREVRDGNW